ncbi:hypothetical protein LJ737_20890 [Hymenobacter sp. 15J16-1T3B]|uniref:hypothetical protein n=1 Tax=Hymenobacter sp. 15J16-1T3B TaxID=2886941 RepID=UPI001D124205|nr:hypothetical protein [Hymenobacter sp. 15J16-1T3B]MCC3159711.1 hypothetical protein [Hymenobacter sp. 15J16-1T3B]
MTAIDLTTLIPRCHEAAKAKGFWDVLPNPGQMLMLAIGELGEAQEADRKGRRVTCNAVHFAPMLAGMPHPTDGARALFETTVKDTVEDELADTYIRLCDYAGGFGIEVAYWENERSSLLKFCDPESVPTNLGEAMLPIVEDIIKVNCGSKTRSAMALSGALLKLELLCAARGIDLATHIDLKLAYNATRPVRHGKAY